VRVGRHALARPASWLALPGCASARGHQAGLGLWARSSEQVLAGAVVATGAALLPDIDHPGATVSRSGGLLTRPLSRAVSRAAGHRGGNHTPLAVAAFTALAAFVNGLGRQGRGPGRGEVEAGAGLVGTYLCGRGTRAPEGG